MNEKIRKGLEEAIDFAKGDTSKARITIYKLQDPPSEETVEAVAEALWKRNKERFQLQHLPSWSDTVKLHPTIADGLRQDARAAITAYLAHLQNDAQK